MGSYVCQSLHVSDSILPNRVSIPTTELCIANSGGKHVLLEIDGAQVFPCCLHSMGSEIDSRLKVSPGRKMITFLTDYSLFDQEKGTKGISYTVPDIYQVSMDKKDSDVFIGQYGLCDSFIAMSRVCGEKKVDVLRKSLRKNSENLLDFISNFKTVSDSRDIQLSPLN